MLIFAVNLVLTILLFTIAQSGINGDVLKTIVFAVAIIAMCLVNYIDGKES